MGHRRSLKQWVFLYGNFKISGHKLLTNNFHLEPQLHENMAV